MPEDSNEIPNGRVTNLDLFIKITRLESEVKTLRRDFERLEAEFKGYQALEGRMSLLEQRMAPILREQERELEMEAMMSREFKVQIFGAIAFMVLVAVAAPIVLHFFGIH